jgi:hypothetical protein
VYNPTKHAVLLFSVKEQSRTRNHNKVDEMKPKLLRKEVVGIFNVSALGKMVQREVLSSTYQCVS